MVECALTKFKKEIARREIEISQANVEQLPYSNSQFDRVFHCNTYYFWHNMSMAYPELYRVMKPNSLMVTTLNIERLKTVKDVLKSLGAKWDPLEYMHKLEMAGFTDVNIQYLTDGDQEYQAIFARLTQKPQYQPFKETVPSS